MARPKSWFEPKEFATAKKFAKSRCKDLWRYTRKTRDGSKETGYYVGNDIPVKLKTAQLEQKSL